MLNIPVSSKPENPAWAPLYAEDCVQRGDAQALSVSGRLPAGLQGGLYHIGPVAGSVFGEPLNNAFSDADGMISAIRFDGGRVSFQARPIETRFSRAESRAQQRLYSTFSTRAPGHSARRAWLCLSDTVATLNPWAPYHAKTTLKDPANHVLCPLGGALIALGGAGYPYRVDRETLECRPASFDPPLPKQALFWLGESHLDPTSGKRFFLELYPYQSLLRLWEVDGVSARSVLSTPTAGVPMMHDFGLTANKLVLPIGPMQLSKTRALRYVLGRSSFMDAFEWRPEQPLQVIVVDRQSGDRRVHTLPSAFPVHVANAFDDGQDVVIDLNVHSNDAAMRGYTAGPLSSAQEPGFRSRLLRLRLRADGTSSATEFCESPLEAPIVRSSYEGRAHRYIYAFEPVRGIVAGRRICKIDTHSSRVDYIDLGQGHIASEPVFVANPAGSAEDDGWILTQVYDRSRDETAVSIVEASAFCQEEARVHTGVRLPYLLHGTFVA